MKSDTQEAVELQVAKGRSIYRSTGEGLLKDKDGSISVSPKEILVSPTRVHALPKVAEFLLRTGACIDPSKAQPVEGALMAGTTSTRVVGPAVAA